MSDGKLTLDEQALLLKEARRALELGVVGKPLDPLNLKSFSTFVLSPEFSHKNNAIVNSIRALLRATKNRGLPKQEN